MKRSKRFKALMLIGIILLLSVNSISAEDGSGKIINMYFKGADIRDVLQSISELAQVNLVTDGSVQGEITINLKDLSFDQALKLITQTYGLGYVWDGNTIVVATPERIEEIYTHNEVEIVKLLTADARHVQGVVSGVYPDLNIMADEANNQLILVGSTQLIGDARALIDKLDVSDNIRTRTLQINYIDIEILAGNIQKLYPDLLLTTDKVNGLVIIKGKKEEVQAAVNLIQEMDKPGSEVTAEVSIRHIEPFVLMEKLKEALPGLQLEEDEENRKLLLRGNKEEINQALALARELDVEAKKALEIMTVDYANLTEIEEIIREFFPDVKVKLNNQNRELIIHGYKDEVEGAIQLLKSLDTPRKQVLIEVRIELLSTSAMKELGIDSENLSTIKFLKDEQNNINGIEITWPELLKYLERNGESQTLANPRLLTLNGEEARLLIGDKIPVELSAGENQTKIEYIDAGITLVFKPWISSDGRITLDINPKISSIGENLYGSLPNIDTREVETKVRLNDGQTLAIGGLIQDEITENISRIPILAEIPIFGKLFENSKKDFKKTEVIIFITPHIIDDLPINVDKEKVEENIPENAIEMMEQELQVNDDLQSWDKAEEKEEGDSPIPSDPSPVVEEKIIKEVNNRDNKEEATYKIIGLTDEELEAILGLEDEDKEAADNVVDNKGDDLESREKVIESSMQETAPVEEQDTVARSDKSSQVASEYYLVDYQVKEGEDLETIAVKFGISKESILDYNQAVSVAPGMVLTVPVPESHLYTLKEGETLWKIHQRYQIDLQQLIEINEIDDYYNLPVGKILVLPIAITE